MRFTELFSKGKQLRFDTHDDYQLQCLDNGGHSANKPNVANQM